MPDPLRRGPHLVPPPVQEAARPRAVHPVLPMRVRISAAVDRAFAIMASVASNPNVHLAGIAVLGIITMPGSLLTGMVCYASLLHARIPLLTLQTLAARILAADAGGTRLMLGILLSGWAVLRPLFSRSSSISFLSGPAHALFSLIPMLVGCLLARLAMEEHPTVPVPTASLP